MIPVFYQCNQFMGAMVYYNIDKAQSIPDITIDVIAYQGAQLIEVTKRNIDSLYADLP